MSTPRYCPTGSDLGKGTSSGELLVSSNNAEHDGLLHSHRFLSVCVYLRLKYFKTLAVAMFCQ